MQIDEIDLNITKDNMLEQYRARLINHGALEVEPEEINIWICYPKKEIEDSVQDAYKNNPARIHKTEVFLFNKINDKCGYVMSRNKYSDRNHIVYYLQIKFFNFLIFKKVFRVLLYYIFNFIHK